MKVYNSGRMGVAAAASILLLAACQTPRVAPPPPVQVAPPQQEERQGWRGVVRADGVDRINATSTAWTQALAVTRAAGFNRRVQSEGALLDPAASARWAIPSPGSYRCRLLRMSPGGRRRGLMISGPFFCHIGDEGDQLSLTQQTGPERPGGYLWPDTDRRMVFAGAVSRGREDVPPAYGSTPERDVVGVFERVGSFRYRLVMPRPEGVLDVLELVPALPAA